MSLLAYHRAWIFPSKQFPLDCLCISSQKILVLEFFRRTWHLILFHLQTLFFCPVTLQAILFVLYIVGLPNFFQVCTLILDRSEPELNCSLILLFRMLTCIYFLLFRPSDSSVLVTLTKLLFFFLIFSLQCVLLWPTSFTIETFFFL